MEVENFIKVLFNWENFLAVWEVVLGEIEIYKYVFNQDPQMTPYPVAFGIFQNLDNLEV